MKNWKNVNKEVASNKSKHVLVENELKQLETFDLSLFFGQSYFFNYKVQLYLIFQPLYYILKTLSNSEKVISSKSESLSNEKITISFTTDMKIQNVV